MQTLESIAAVRGLVAARRRDGEGVALVPTMGNLHEGHLSLARVARARAGCVIASVFVNPLQFGPGEDFERYPRSFGRDCELLEAEGVDAVFAPPVAEMYPAEAGQQTLVVVPAFSRMLEGESRPGHFDGVATVVIKLFNIVMPDVAVFGEKDFQQLALIRRLVRDLCLPIDIVGAPIVRDPDGLAMSSRNQYLSPAERRVAPALHRALEAASRRIAAGDRAWPAIEASVTPSVAAWVLGAHHIADSSAQLSLLARGAGLVLLQSALVWLFYLAVEPYARRLPGWIAEAIGRAAGKLVPVRVGWTVVDDPRHTHCRRWIHRPDKIDLDPFGEQTVRAMMHPGYQNPGIIEPAGPIDPEVGVLACARPDGTRKAVYVNYACHLDCVGGTEISADYPGYLIRRLQERLEGSARAFYLLNVPAGPDIMNLPEIQPFQTQGSQGIL